MDCASKFRVWLGIAVLVSGTMQAATPTRAASATVVLFNANDPESKDIAGYYASRRNIPATQVVGLDCPVMEEIPRADYERTIAAPLKKIFRSRGWWTMGRNTSGEEVVTDSDIRFLAIVKGMPLKIAPDPTLPPAKDMPGVPALIASRNEASVDSELATLGMPLPGPGGIFPNPYYRRFTPILENPVYPGLLLPSRLDGPTAFIVRAMIDDAISTEKEGLKGWSYVDGRGITTGGYAEGDKWMGQAVVDMRAQGLPVIFDNTPPTFPEGYPVTDAAVYYGWYAGSVEGPFADPKFQFRPGAVAVHIHSFSASTLLNPVANWCAPLLAHGAAATLGNVYEPYLSLTANLDVFQERLMTGFTLAESAWMSQKALSWMGVCIGDPLYRPYAAWRNVDIDGQPDAWDVYRRIVLQASGNVLLAADALGQEGEKSGNSLFPEALGAAQMDAKDWTGALESLRLAGKLAAGQPSQIRIDLETIATLQALGKESEATELARASASTLLPGPQKNLFSKFGPAPSPSVAPIALAEDSPGEVSPAPSPTPSPEPTPDATPLPPPPLPELTP